jgi:glycosyltransferase involved in cell wall biosynthesis
MRILQVTEAAGGGLLGVVAPLAGGLAAADHEVAFAFGCRPETPEDLADRLPDGVEAFPLPWGRRTLPAQVAAARALRRLVRDWHPDVVHLHSSFAGIVGSIALGRRTPVIYSPHAYAFASGDVAAPARAAYRAAEWVTARRCTLVGAVSDAEAQIARGVLRAPRVAAVANGIPELDPGAAPGAPAERRRLVVGMGRIGPQQRPQESARILGALAADAEVRWIGAAPDGRPTPLEAAGVPITGWLDHDEARRKLAEATVYVHWSGWDGQSLAILEALARDVVVVASDIPPNREILGERAVCREPEAAIALARAALDDPALRETLLADQRARRDRFSTRRMVEGWLGVYDRIVTPTHAAAAAGAPAVLDPRIGAPWS